MSVFRKMYEILASAKLAIVLLIAILVCCVAGVTIFRGDAADAMIFRTIWFNGLLVLLAMNIAFCFFGRIWGRKLTLITFGMILFHLSFIVMLGGYIYNSLFYFKGALRLTEGETLKNTKPETFDSVKQGRFFNFSKLKGETTLVKMHKNYKVDGVNKGVAYEIAAGEGIMKRRAVVYMIRTFFYHGFEYFIGKEGYSLLIVVHDKKGKELFGFYVPLQSLKQKNGTYLYTTGTREAPGVIVFPQPPFEPLFGLQFSYRPSSNELTAESVFFQVWPLSKTDANSGRDQKPLAEGTAAVGEKFRAGDYYIEAREVRYWVSMNVLHNPGWPSIQVGFWLGFGGLVLTLFGRVRRISQDGSSPAL